MAQHRPKTENPNIAVLAAPLADPARGGLAHASGGLDLTPEGRAFCGSPGLADSDLAQRVHRSAAIVSTACFRPGWKAKAGFFVARLSVR